MSNLFPVLTQQMYHILTKLSQPLTLSSRITLSLHSLLVALTHPLPLPLLDLQTGSSFENHKPLITTHITLSLE